MGHGMIRTRFMLAVAMVMVLCVPGVLNADAVIVDHSNFDDILFYDQATLDAIGEQKIFFSHASVGVNMMTGMSELRSSDSNRYQLGSVSSGATPPSSTVDGNVYEYQRGNPGWSAKFANFQTYVDNGWRSDKVDIAMDKLCYIDQTANVNTYISLMSGLEASYPDTFFVYMTMPLTTSSDSNAILRHNYNEAVREYVIANDKAMLDIADIEAWSPSDVEQTFSYVGSDYQRLDYQRMYSGYTSDGGHLISAGYIRVAQGMYSLFGSLLKPPPIPGDANGDGLVSLLDLDILGQYYGEFCDLGNSCGDFNGNGSVTLLDLDILGDNWGETADWYTPMPEPGSFLLFGICGMMLARRR